MKISIKSQILAEIEKHGRGWTFSPADFATEYARREIDESFSTLAAEGHIRRIMRGIYDYPMRSELLAREIAPDIQKVAYALARKFKWKIFPEGNTALNYLGLSTQMVGQHIYLSDGPSRKYSLGKLNLVFKHKTQRQISLNGNKEAVILVQAIRTRGEENLSDEFIRALASKYPPSEWNRMACDAASAPIWIHETIKKISTLTTLP